MQHTLLLDAVTLYLDYLEAAGRSPLTLDRYRQLLRSCFAKYPFPDPLDVRDFLDSFPSRNTRATVLVMLRHFFRWAKQRGLSKTDPSEGIPRPRPTRRQWPILTEEEFSRACAFLDRELVVLATILYRVGSRIRETVSMRVEHISFEGKYGIIDFPSRKGGESGFAAFGPEVSKVLRPWLSGRQGWVFPAKTNPTKHLTPGIAWDGLVRAGKKAGLTSQLSPHRFRHSMITNSVDSGWSQLALQQQVGHRSASSTAVYYKPTRQGLLRALRSACKNT